MCSPTLRKGLHYWRDKSGRELDFVLRRGREVDTFECKLNPDRFEPDGLSVFRASYPLGRNYLVCPDVKVPYERRFKSLTVKVAEGHALDASLRGSEAGRLEQTRSRR